MSVGHPKVVFQAHGEMDRKIGTVTIYSTISTRLNLVPNEPVGTAYFGVYFQPSTIRDGRPLLWMVSTLCTGRHKSWIVRGSQVSMLFVENHNLVQFPV